MIIVTGAAGFIGSCLVGKLNNKGLTDIIMVDDFTREDKAPNTQHKVYREKIPRGEFFNWLDQFKDDVEFFFHIGARTDTTEFNKEVFDELNLNWSKKAWETCTERSIPLVYASSAATYGMGELGYEDSHDLVFKLKPLNAYGESKNDFDKWVLQQKNSPPFWAGMKFFNVYGPNEYHKGRMASVIYHAYRQIEQSGMVKLFRSHRPDYKDGMQLRDFIYVKDVLDVLYFLMKRGKESGIYNLGTGNARTFYDLVTAVFHSMDLPRKIKFIDTPEDIRDKYQYFTEAGMQKLRKAGYDDPFYTLEEGVEEYVKEFLVPRRYF
jgi:ADP-L-glycero-D-manno-heptose 6-epimerase